MLWPAAIAKIVDADGPGAARVGGEHVVAVDVTMARAIDAIAREIEAATSHDLQRLAGLCAQLEHLFALYAELLARRQLDAGSGSGPGHGKHAEAEKNGNQNLEYIRHSASPVKAAIGTVQDRADVDKLPGEPEDYFPVIKDSQGPAQKLIRDRSGP
jgi:hypothetical protein